MTRLPPSTTAMIVDDDLIDQQWAQRTLESSGLIDRVICFLYPDEALDFLRRKQRPAIDVTFLNLNMPRLNGIDFLEVVTQELGAGCLGSVTILATALSHADAARAFACSVVEHVITKPLRPEDIVLVCEPETWRQSNAPLQLPTYLKANRLDFRMH
ncbi:MAG: response regulator [Pseudomonadota bacterium]